MNIQLKIHLQRILKEHENDSKPPEYVITIKKILELEDKL
jgi:hypothetical protein